MALSLINVVHGLILPVLSSLASPAATSLATFGFALQASVDPFADPVFNLATAAQAVDTAVVESGLGSPALTGALPPSEARLQHVSPTRRLCAL